MDDYTPEEPERTHVARDVMISKKLIYLIAENIRELSYDLDERLTKLEKDIEEIKNKVKNKKHHF